MSHSVLLKVEGSIATVMLNRPNAYNALDATMAEGLSQVLSQVERDPAVKVVVLSGAGPAFMCCGDIKSFDRSIAFGHGRLAVIRLSIAAEAGATISASQWSYCQAVVELSRDANLNAVMRQARLRCSHPFVPVSASDGTDPISTQEYL